MNSALCKPWRQRIIPAALWLCILLQGALTLIFSLTLRHELKTSAYDGMVIAQALYNFIAGHGLVATIDPPYVVQHWFGIHFSPVLYLLAPFYYMFPHVETLLVFQSYMIALTAWPLFITARRLLESSGQAFVIALLYLINPYVVNAAIWDFHEIAFAPLCIATMLWALVNKRRYALLALSFILMGIKEHYGISVAGFGVLWAWYWRERAFGLSMGAMGLVAFGVIIFIIMPHFSPLGLPAMMNPSLSTDRISWIFHPFGAHSPLFSLMGQGVLYYLGLLLPFWLLPLASPMWLLAGAADIIVNTLSAEPWMRSATTYHSAALLPVILIACVMTLKKYFNRDTRCSRRDMLVAISILAFFMGYSMAALPFINEGNQWEFSAPRLALLPQDREALESIEAMIPSDAVLSAQNNVLPQLNVRFSMYHFPERAKDVDYIILYTGFPYERQTEVLGSPYGVTGEEYFSAVNQLFSEQGWGVVFFKNQWLVLKWHAPDDTAARSAAMHAVAQTQKYYRSIHLPQ